MIGWLLRATFGTLCFVLLGYVVVAVPIGRRTLFEHGTAIARTRPAQELATDVEQAMTRAVDRARTGLSRDGHPERDDTPR